MGFPSSTQLQSEVNALMEEMSDPDVMKDAERMKEMAPELNQKKELLEIIQKLESAQAELSDVTSMLSDSSDDEMTALAQDDIKRLESEIVSLTRDVEQLIVSTDPRDSRDVILEIRAGAGGDEAGLFAAELFRAYTRYAEVHGWRVAIVSSSSSEAGGYKEVVAEISGKQVYGTLKYEKGVHRVQRIPETEKMGRVHTSTITIAVMPKAEEVDVVIKPEDLRIDTFRASGAGGQHVNKTDSAVRITHMPTNTVVSCQEERSQHKNREKAMSILRSRILANQEEERHQKIASERREQVGTGDRSEKIRTYNYPQDRITDHRIKQSWSDIPKKMEGDFGDIFQALRDADRELSLKRISEDDNS